MARWGLLQVEDERHLRGDAHFSEAYSYATRRLHRGFSRNAPAARSNPTRPQNPARPPPPPSRSSLPSCPLCTELLGTYGGPTTLPCGHSSCIHCATYLQSRSPTCPVCRSPFPADKTLAVNCDMRELLRMAEALTAVEGVEADWMAVTSKVRRRRWRL